MTVDKDFNKVSVLIVGAGPAGLACALSVKRRAPQADVCVIDKSPAPGNHNLSGAVLEMTPLRTLLDAVGPAGWDQSEQAKDIFARTVVNDSILFLPNSKLRLDVSMPIRIAGRLGLNIGEMQHHGDCIVSVSKLAAWMTKLARDVGVEVLHGFSAATILYDPSSERANGVRLVDQGLTRDGAQQANFLPGEEIKADIVVLAEGCDGLLAEQFISAAGLRRNTPQIFSVGVKELIKVTEEQYRSFGDRSVLHALGYPIWTPVLGPSMFGGGLLYSYGDNTLAVGMIVGADWKEYDFNPQDALVHFKNHSLIKKYIGGGKVIEAGAKMIPEGGYHAVPRDPETGAVGKGNVLLLGDSAGFVNMLKIKGLHNAIESGTAAAHAIVDMLEAPMEVAARYTSILEQSSLMKEMTRAANFRQTVARFGNLVGLPLSVLGRLLPFFRTEPDYKAMRSVRYRYKGNKEFDKNSFTAMAHTEHREDQPSHLSILNSEICLTRCAPNFARACITFCPAGVYEEIQGIVKPANASNCLHCKTCQRKCPYDNIRWTVPEGGGGPRYKGM